ncbi:MAG: hypothetical protein IPM57_08630 [Oligoflexia bacterium]|nr:hypothetical protein [Oligoflexia bacterium]
MEKHTIPRPPPGYWQKIQYGYKIPQPPLPVLALENSQVTIYKSDKIDSKNIKMETKESVEITPPHPLVEKTRKNFKPSYPDKFGRLTPKDQSLNIAVTKDSIDRALSVMDVIIKNFEQLNYEVSIVRNTNNHDWDEWFTQVNVCGEQIKFHIEEQVTKKIKFTCDQKWGPRRDFEYLPTGKLSIIIDTYVGESIQKTWSDTKSNTFNSKVESFINALAKASEFLKMRRIEQEKWQRECEQKERERREEEERKRKKEEQLRKIESQINSWEKAEKIRRFVLAVEIAANNKNGKIEPESELGLWISLIKSYADSMDPIYVTFNKETANG